MDGGLPKLENIVIPGKGPMELLDVSASLAQSAVSWADFSWIRQLWKGPLVVKGILTAEDARRAVSEGAAAVVVSNHGGRQLDEVYPTIRALPEVVAAVADQTEVLMDGGIRRGTDIVKALCLGARAVLIGRAYAYGLAAGGYHGVKKAIQILWEDVERTMRLLGCPAISDLNESYIEYPREWKAH
jgi:L-lactate dehydrogenase (cytochrome)